MVIPAITRFAPPIDMTREDARLVMWVYSAGFTAMMLVFAMLYWNQHRRRVAFNLSLEQVFAARAGARTHMLSVAVGLISIVLALTVPIQWIWTAGVIYALQGPLHWRNGVLIERARVRMFQP
jgi:hypothetical protein